MKATKAAAWLIVMALASATALGQSKTAVTGVTPVVPFAPGFGYGSEYPSEYWEHASTAGEGAARGLGELVRSAGVYNWYTSAAAVNLTEARRNAIENDKLWTQAYFDLREFNRQRRDTDAKRSRGTPEEWSRYAQAGKPKPLAGRELDVVTGAIRWPILLTARDFEADRGQLEKLFADRAYHGILQADDYLTAVRVTDNMRAGLKARINSVPAVQYMAARRFLESLAYEAGQPAG